MLPVVPINIVLAVLPALFMGWIFPNICIKDANAIASACVHPTEREVFVIDEQAGPSEEASDEDSEDRSRSDKAVQDAPVAYKVWKQVTHGDMKQRVRELLGPPARAEVDPGTGQLYDVYYVDFRKEGEEKPVVQLMSVWYSHAESELVVDVVRGPHYPDA